MSETKKGEYWAARAGGRVSQAVKAHARKARISAGSDRNGCSNEGFPSNVPSRYA